MEQFSNNGDKKSSFIQRAHDIFTHEMETMEGYHALLENYQEKILKELRFGLSLAFFKAAVDTSTRNEGEERNKLLNNACNFFKSQLGQMKIDNIGYVMLNPERIINLETKQFLTTKQYDALRLNDPALPRLIGSGLDFNAAYGIEL